MEVLQGTYKDTKIGRIPKDWDVMKLKDLGTFFKGQSVSSNHITSDGKPIIRYGDLYVQYKNKNTVTHFAFFADPKILKEDKNLLYGDILFTGTGETQEDIGKCVAFLRNDEAYAGGDIIVFRPNSNNVNSEVLSYILSTGKVLNAKQRLGQGSSIFHTYSQHLEKLNIPLPPLPEQQKIAAILSTVDEQISTKDKIIEKSKELKKGLMQKLFSEGIGHTEFKDTKIGRIPKDWEVKTLEDVFHFNNGKGHEQFIEENGDYIVVNSKFISREGRVKKFSNKQMSPLLVNDITMVMSDVPNGKALAKCFLIEKNNRYSLNQRICGLRLKDEEKDNVNFFFYNLNRNKGFLKYNDGVSQTNLRKSEVLGCLLAYPSNEEQKKIAAILLEAGAKIEKEQTQKAQLEQLKKGLMQQLLTGKKRVRV